MRKINHLNLLHQLNHTLHKRQVRRVLVTIILPVSVILKLNHECVRDAILIRQQVELFMERSGWKDVVPESPQ